MGSWLVCRASTPNRTGSPFVRQLSKDRPAPAAHRVVNASKAARALEQRHLLLAPVKLRPLFGDIWETIVADVDRELGESSLGLLRSDKAHALKPLNGLQ